MKILMNKRCPRCGGNIFLEEDSFGCYEHCLQCGYDHDLENIVESPRASRPIQDRQFNDSKCQEANQPKGGTEVMGKTSGGRT